MLRTRLSRLGVALFTPALLVGAVAFLPTTASALIISQTPSTANCSNTTTTPDAGYETGWTKINASTGTATGPFGTITAVGTKVTYNLNAGFVAEICVKGGPGSITYTVSGSGDLFAPINDSGGPAGVSHWSFRIVSDDTPNEPPGADLTAGKTVACTYDRAFTWDVEKSVVGPAVVTTAAPTHTFNYSIVATKSAPVDSNFTCGGVITIYNSNDTAATDVDVTDDLGVAGSVCTVTGGVDATVPANANLPLAYSCTGLTTASTGTNTATVTWDPASVGSDPLGGSTTATAGFTFSQNGTATNDCTDVTDAFNGGTPDLLGNTCVTATFPNSRTVNVPATGCTGLIPNTAAVTGDTDSENVQVCSSWIGETATGRGTDWTKSSNWFMFTPLSAFAGGAIVDLVAGQHFDAGDIALSGNQLTIALHSGNRFAAVGGNVKVQSLTSCAAGQKYIQPGAYSIKTTASGNSITLTVPITGCALAIHVDVQRNSLTT